MADGPRVVGDGATRGKENKFFFACGTPVSFEPSVMDGVFIRLFANFPVWFIYLKGSTMRRLPRLPAGALLTFCGRSRETVIKITKPHLCMFFLEELNFLGDSLGPGSGFHMAPPWWSGVLLGLSAVLHGILCYISQSVHLIEAQ